jgi:hypothetical protein
VPLSSWRTLSGSVVSTCAAHEVRTTPTTPGLRTYPTRSWRFRSSSFDRCENFLQENRAVSSNENLARDPLCLRIHVRGSCPSTTESLDSEHEIASAPSRYGSLLHSHERGGRGHPLLKIRFLHGVCTGRLVRLGLYEPDMHRGRRMRLGKRCSLLSWDTHRSGLPLLYLCGMGLG